MLLSHAHLVYYKSGSQRIKYHLRTHSQLFPFTFHVRNQGDMRAISLGSYFFVNVLKEALAPTSLYHVTST